MNQLGYYAKDKENDLYQFRWKSDSTFEIKFGVQWIEKNPKDFEILEIGFFTADSPQPIVKSMHYSQFLFSQLLIAYSESFKEMEYDSLFSKSLQGYELFEKSRFNNPNLPEYECIEEFLKSTISTPYFKIYPHYREEEVFLMTGLEFCVDRLDKIDTKRVFEVPVLLVIEFEIWNK